MARKKSSARSERETRKSTTGKVASRKKMAPSSAAKTPEPFLDGDEIRKELNSRWSELFPQRLKVEAVFKSHHDALMALPNVSGLHIGLRRTNGNIVSPLEYCIRVHVHKKYPEGHPHLIRPLDNWIGGVRINVWEQSYSMSAAGGPVSTFQEPLRGGVAIAKEGTASNWGTLGFTVFSGSEIRFLTNRHIAGNNGSVILQPPDGTVPAGRTARIGTVIDSEIDDQRIDAALIKPSSDRRVERTILGVNSRVFLTGILTKTDERRTVAFKVGAKTGFTPIRVGIVKSVSATVDVKGRQMFNQIIVESETGEDLIDGGDSGAVLVVQTKQDGLKINQIVGLVHAEGSASGDDSATTGSPAFKNIVACHFHDVQSRFGIDVIDRS